MYMYTQGHSRIEGTGSYLPEARITSAEIMQQAESMNRFGLRPGWLEKVTGVRERRVTPAGLVPSDMAVHAAKEAMDRAKITARELDVIIFAGIGRDHLLEPSTAHIVQKKLGADNATVFDVSNACLGFLTAMQLLDALISTGQARHGLIACGEQGHRYVEKAIAELHKTHNREDFNVLAAGLTLGDAGAAIVMGPKLDPDAGFMGFVSHSEGKHAGMCYCGTDTEDTPLYTDMAGISREAGRMIGEAYNELVVKHLGWRDARLAKLASHQAGKGNFRILSEATHVPIENIPDTVSTLGNIITATVPIILHSLVNSREIAEGARILLSGSGGGISVTQGAFVWDMG